MLRVTHLSKSYADREILRGVSFLISPGERAGLVGPNGVGKTTLFKIILGEEAPDSGTVQLAPGLRVGYLAQGLDAPPTATVASLLEAALGTAEQVEAELAHAALALAQTPTVPHIQEKYEAALTRLQSYEENADPARVALILRRLGLSAVPHEQTVSSLSGGQKTRLSLALVLLGQPQLLLLDEPTNHLDLEMLAWLENWLAEFRGAVLLISHDRAFLDASVNRILELDALTHTVKSCAGNYADYLEQKQAEIEQQWQAHSDWQTEVARLRDAARHLRGLTKMRKGGKADDGDKFAKGFFSDQTTQMVKKAKNVERRLERLAQDERAAKPKRQWTLKLEFGEAPASGRDVLILENVSVGYGAPLLENINLQVRHGERVALIGPNGSGKTTLVRTLLNELTPLAGRVRLGANVRVGYFAQEHSALNAELSALTTLQKFSNQPETELRAFLHFFLFEGDEVFTPVNELSYGERARLVLATLVVQGCNFLVLDEPLNHLDIASRERFEQALTQFEGTALVIAHDRYFIERFATHVWQAEQGTVKVYADLAGALEHG
jgi:ATP-binding cassette subfamily F protein 3